jgi:hypothetical protein
MIFDSMAECIEYIKAHPCPAKKAGINDYKPDKESMELGHEQILYPPLSEGTKRRGRVVPGRDRWPSWDIGLFGSDPGWHS